MKSQSTNLRDAEQGQETQPVFLYFIDHGDAQSFFTNYDQPITITGVPDARFADPQVFTPAQINHSRPDESADMTPRQVNVNLAANDPKLRVYFLTAPVKGIAIQIFRANSANITSSIDFADIMLEFKGIAQSAGFKGYNVSANFISPLLQEDRVIPRFFYQKTCNHQLYSKFCTVNKALYGTSISVVAVDRFNKTVDVTLTTIHVDSPTRDILITNETFAGGLLTDAAGNNYGIMACETGLGAGSTCRLWMEWWPPTIAVSDVVTIYPGCLLVPRVCNSTFNNLANFGGMPYVPTANPAIDSIMTGNANGQ